MVKSSNLVHSFMCLNQSLPDVERNKIEGTLILKLAIVKRLQVKKKLLKKIKIHQKNCQKDLTKQLSKKSSKSHQKNLSKNYDKIFVKKKFVKEFAKKCVKFRNLEKLRETLKTYGQKLAIPAKVSCLGGLTQIARLKEK